MDKSFMFVLGLSLVFLGFAVLVLAMRWFWVSELYVPPKRKRRSRAGINLKDK
jgi:hypothetical protein